MSAQSATPGASMSSFLIMGLTRLVQWCSSTTHHHPPSTTHEPAGTDHYNPSLGASVYRDNGSLGNTIFAHGRRRSAADLQRAREPGAHRVAHPRAQRI